MLQHSGLQVAENSRSLHLVANLLVVLGQKQVLAKPQINWAYKRLENQTKKKQIDGITITLFTSHNHVVKNGIQLTINIF